MRRRVSADRGASAVEYGLIVFAVAAILALVVAALGGLTQDLFEHTKTCIDNHDSTSCS